MKAYKLVSYALVFYLLVPYFLFLSFFDFNFNVDLQELLWAFKNSFTQSFLAATFVTSLSVPLSLGLFQFKGRSYETFKKLLLVPQILPSFFSILIAFSIWKPFPLGSVGITFVFTLVHLGFAVVLIHTATRERMGPYPIVAKVFALSRWKFLTKIYFPLIRKDLIACFLLIFIFCFSSFAIPLVAGGGRDTNIEVLVFEKIYISQKWSMAWTISVFQGLFLTFLSLLLVRNSNATKREFLFSQYLHSNFGFGFILIYLAVYFGGYAFGLLQALPDFLKVSLFYSELLTASFYSLSLFFVYVFITFTLVYFWLYDFANRQKLNFGRNLIAASTMMVGFSFYLYFPQSRGWDYFKIPLAMSILVFPVLFKSFLERPLLDLKDQVVTAKVFGISNFKIILKILLPQMSAAISIWFSFLTIWFLSDFATLRALGTQTQTLGLMAESFLTSYRISLAYLMSVYILLVWMMVLVLGFVVKGALRVTYQKFEFKF